jgi:hypothetical protein
LMSRSNNWSIIASGQVPEFKVIAESGLLVSLPAKPLSDNKRWEIPVSCLFWFVLSSIWLYLLYFLYNLPHSQMKSISVGLAFSYDVRLNISTLLLFWTNSYSDIL